MSTEIDLDKWWAERQVALKKFAEGKRTRWLVEHPDVEPPELDFPYPPCSVCGLDTWHDGDGFRCDECGISWSNNGPGTFDQCEFQGPKVFDGYPGQFRWCRLRSGHDGLCRDSDVRWGDEDEVFAGSAPTAAAVVADMGESA